MFNPDCGEMLCRCTTDEITRLTAELEKAQRDAVAHEQTALGYFAQLDAALTENAALWELLSNMRIEIDSAEAENAALRELLADCLPQVRICKKNLSLINQIRAAIDDAKGG